jgi:hypothetical protein
MSIPKCEFLLGIHQDPCQKKKKKRKFKKTYLLLSHLSQLQDSGKYADFHH